MAYKRNIDRLPIPPKDAKVQNVTCPFCIVGCGYKAISWYVDRQGGPKPPDNFFATDLTHQQEAETANWFSPAMYNIVKQNGRDVHLVIKPDKECEVNSGLGSIRGARQGELSFSTITGTQGQRLTEPLVYRYGGMVPTSWDDALWLAAEVTRRVIEEQGEDGLIVSAFDHGGAGGGYENTWATGKLYFESMKMDPPGSAKPDCLIIAGLAQALEKSWRKAGKNDVADKFKGYDWKTEEDAFMDGYSKHATGGNFVTYERLRTMGTNGFQEPATDFRDGKIIGTKRLYADGKFGKDGKAKFMATQWRGLEAPGKQQEKEKFAYLVNNGRANHVWQSIYLDQYNDFVMDRWPLPFLELNPDDMRELGVNPGDLVEIYNDNGSTQAMAQPRATAKPKQSFMLFAYPTGTMGNVASKGVNELIIPNYKQTWANIRKIADAPEITRRLTFKSQEYVSG